MKKCKSETQGEPKSEAKVIQVSQKGKNLATIKYKSNKKTHSG